MIERKTFLHEILLRFGPDGFQGAHVADATCMVEDGAIVPGSVREEPPRPVSKAEIGKHLNAEMAGVLEAAALLRSQMLEHQERADAAEAALETQREASQQALQDLATRKNAQIDDLRATIASATQRANMAEAAIAAAVSGTKADA